MNFVLVFILSASFIAYAPDYIKKINDFSSDISNASLSLGTKIVMPQRTKTIRSDCVIWKTGNALSVIYMVVSV